MINSILVSAVLLNGAVLDDSFKSEALYEQSETSIDEM